MYIRVFTRTLAAVSDNFPTDGALFEPFFLALKVYFNVVNKNISARNYIICMIDDMNDSVTKICGNSIHVYININKII